MPVIWLPVNLINMGINHKWGHESREGKSQICVTSFINDPMWNIIAITRVDSFIDKAKHLFHGAQISNQKFLLPVNLKKKVSAVCKIRNKLLNNNTR